MCTALGFKNCNNYYFGRTLDVSCSHGEQIVIAPRAFKFDLRCAAALEKHYAMIGMAHVANGVPLYYDGLNEKGLCIAGLNFPQNTVYHATREGKLNVAPFEVIPFILGTCADIAEAKDALKIMNITDVNFSEEMPHTPMHWIVGDKSGEIVVESVADGLKIYDNPVGVLTNNPPFETQLFNLKNYTRLSPANPENSFAKELDLTPYSRGMGALGLPGDWSSPSRFVRAAFAKFNRCKAELHNGVASFFRIIGVTAVPKGCVLTEEGCQYTVYTSCMDAAEGVYHYHTYDGLTVISADIHAADLDGAQIKIF